MTTLYDGAYPNVADIPRESYSRLEGISRQPPPGASATMGGRAGNAPLETQPWYHGNIDRGIADQRLSSMPDGGYLVRVGTQAPYVLALR